MRLGTRYTLTMTLLVTLAIGATGLVAVRIRSAELQADLERETQSIGKALRVALEAAEQEGLYEDVRRLVARIRAAEPPLGIAYLELLPPAAPAPAATGSGDAGSPGDGGAAGALGDGGARSLDGGTAPTDEENDEDAVYHAPPPDATRDARIRRILIDPVPYGEHIEIGGKLVYAYTVPLRDGEQRVVAAIDLTRDETDAAAALLATERNVALTVLVAGLAFAAFVFFSTRRSITRPLERLVEGIDEVAVGDLTRVLLRERDDEIGELTDRFNQMTSNLREARAETQRGVEARLALEARLRQSEKLATIGQLAAQLAHEVGTPLSVIGGRARTLEKRARAVEPSAPTGDDAAAPDGIAAAAAPAIDAADVAKHAGIIAAQATRITRIIQQLLDVARKRATERRPLELAEVIKDTLDFLEQQLAQARVTVDIRSFTVERGDSDGAGPAPPDAPIVVGDGEQLQQVCLNLCVNALQAMPQGGRLVIGCGGVVRRKPGLEAAAPRRYVYLEVADTGVGIPPEDRERIFEPFYSTKQATGGTGLGLAVSQGIVKDHDGWIEVEGRPAGGTVFRVYLPAPPAAEGVSP